MSAETDGLPQAIDPWYDLYTTVLKDPDLLDQLIQPSVERFREAGYQSAIVSEKQNGLYVLHVIAVVSKQQQDQAPQIVSDKAREFADQHQFKTLTESEHEPNQVSFF